MVAEGGKGSRALCSEMLLEVKELCLNKTQGTGVGILGVALEEDVNHGCNGFFYLRVYDPELTEERRAAPKGTIAEPRLSLEEEAKADV